MAVSADDGQTDDRHSANGHLNIFPNHPLSAGHNSSLSYIFSIGHTHHMQNDEGQSSQCIHNVVAADRKLTHLRGMC
jgi:hypothetical protein